MEETEAKFVLAQARDAEQIVRYLAGCAGVHALDTMHLRDVYLDGEDAPLRAAGWTCRLRSKYSATAGEILSLELKSMGLGSGLVAVREELSQPLFETPELPIKVRRIDPGEVASRVDTMGVRRLASLFTLMTERRPYRVVLREGAELEMSVDACRVVAADGTTQEVFAELELELVSGEHADVLMLAETLSARGLSVSRLSKYDRAAWATGHTRPRKVAPVARDQSSGELLRGQLRRWLSRVRHYGTLAEEGVNTNGVRLLRTNIRRIRSAVRSCLPELGSSGEHFAGALAELARGVGGVRDLDMFRDAVSARLDALQDVDGRARELLLARLLAGSDAAELDARRALASLPSVLEEGERLLASRFPQSWPTVETLAERVLLKRWRQLKKGGRRVSATSPNEALHDMRLKAKRLRYALELFAPAFGREAKGYARMTRTLQDSFGAHQDACVAIERLRRVGDEMPSDGASRDALILLGRLLEDQYALASSTRERALADWQRFEKLVRKRDIKRLISAP